MATLPQGTKEHTAHNPQGGVEWQIRTLKAQTKQSYKRNIPMEHPLSPWIVRRSARIMNRPRSNGSTGYFNRWNKEEHTTLCEFGETAQHMPPTVKQLLRLKPSFYNGVWLGKDATTAESLNRDYMDTAPPLQPETTGLCTHRPMEYTSISTAYTDSVTMQATAKAPTPQEDAATSAGAEGKRQSAAQQSAWQSS